MINLRVPGAWLTWIAENPRALFLDLLMFGGFGCFVTAAFLFNTLLGVGVLGLALILLSILIATTTGGE